MKKIKKILLFAVVTAVLMLGFAFGASAVTGQCGQNVFYYYDSSTGEFIIRGEGAVDEWWDVHNVEDWRNIKTVIVENGVTSLGKSNPAFSGCLNLKNVVLPEGVIAIPKAYFCDCPALDGVVIPESCTSIGMEAFAECTKLKNIVIPKNVTKIGCMLFGDAQILRVLQYNLIHYLLVRLLLKIVLIFPMYTFRAQRKSGMK